MADLEGLSDEQLVAISKACELLARIQMGQLEEIVELFEGLSVEQHLELVEKLAQLRTSIPQFAQLSAQQHLRISSTLVPDMARNAFDIHQTIQHYWQQKSQLASGKIIVASHNQHQHGTSPLPKIRA